MDEELAPEVVEHIERIKGIGNVLIALQYKLADEIKYQLDISLTSSNDPAMPVYRLAKLLSALTEIDHEFKLLKKSL